MVEMNGNPPQTPGAQQAPAGGPPATQAPAQQPQGQQPNAPEPQAPPAAQQQLPEQDAKQRIGEALNVSARALVQASQLLDQFPQALTPESTTIVKQAMLALGDVAQEIDGTQTPAAEGTVAPEVSPTAPAAGGAPGATPPPGAPTGGAPTAPPQQ